MNILIRLIVSAAAVVASSYLLPGVQVDGWKAALIVALVLGLINAIIKPIITILTLPITILTLGLFALVINALLVLLADAIVPGFNVDGFLWAFIFGLVLSVVNFLVKRFD
ncbi:MAG: phage holin family protein [bacterium]|nr:phage holin family protein [bacterium]